MFEALHVALSGSGVFITNGDDCGSLYRNVQ